MNITPFEYQVDDVTCRGVLAVPCGGLRRPGVLIAHEAPGLGEHVQERAGMLAKLGYVALAADLYGGGHVASSREETLQLMQSLRAYPALLRRRIRGAFDALCALEIVDHRRTAAIGYCFGGLAVLELARSGAPVGGVVSFHGILSTPEPATLGSVTAKILVCAGAEDHLVSSAQIEAFEKEMTAAEVDWQVVRYSGARHGFTNKAAREMEKMGFGYSETADRRSWTQMRTFMAEVFDAI